MSSENLRMARINKQLQRELALIFESRIKKAGVKSIIITEVDCTKDLEKARVYFTALEHKKCPGILKDLNEIKGAVRSLLGQSIKLRRVPELEFVIDSSSEYGAKIDRILDSLGLIDHEAKHSGFYDGGDDNDDEDEEL